MMGMQWCVAPWLGESARSQQLRTEMDNHVSLDYFRMCYSPGVGEGSARD